MPTPFLSSANPLTQNTCYVRHAAEHHAGAFKVVFSADEAVRRCKDGEKVILVRIETSPDDIHGLHAAEGVLTTRGRRAGGDQIGLLENK